LPGRKHALIHTQYLVSLINQYADGDIFVTADVDSTIVLILSPFQGNGKRFILYGVMANAMLQALRLEKVFDWQVISISGDGGLAMLPGGML